MPTYLSWDLGVRNLSVCHVTVTGAHLTDELLGYDIHHWEILDVVAMNNAHVTNCNRLPIDRATRYLCHALSIFYDKHAAVLGSVKVLIEQQPVGFHRRSNTLMKVLSHVLQSFFVLKGHSVEFVSPKQKNKLSSVQAQRDNVPSMKTTARYAWHKREAVRRTEEILESCGHEAVTHCAWFRTLSKKDDAADALLNAVCYYRNTIEKKKVTKKNPKSHSLV